MWKSDISCQPKLHYFPQREPDPKLASLSRRFSFWHLCLLTGRTVIGCSVKPRFTGSEQREAVISLTQGCDSQQAVRAKNKKNINISQNQNQNKQRNKQNIINYKSRRGWFFSFFDFSTQAGASSVRSHEPIFQPRWTIFSFFTTCFQHLVLQQFISNTSWDSAVISEMYFLSLCKCVNFWAFRNNYWHFYF